MHHENNDKTMSILEEVLSYCEGSGLKELLVACPEGIGRRHFEWLRARPEVAVIVLPPDNLPDLNDGSIGRFVPDEYSWRLPERSVSTIVHVGPRNIISFRMIRQGMRVAGARNVVYGMPGMWKTERTVGFVGRRILERIQWAGNRMLEACGKKIGTYCPVYLIQAISSLQQRVNPRIKWKLRSFGDVARSPLLSKKNFQRETIVFVNSALAWGGAERQLVNTMISLKGMGFQQISLVCENIGLSDDHRFFRHQLGGVRISELGTDGFLSIPMVSEETRGRLKSAVASLPVDLSEDVFRYAIHFLKERPAVVHAWQDATSIKAGLAAVLVGVPRVILSGRNMAPIHFPYYQYYMRPAYRLLAKFEQVKMINNSRAGADDYERWLGIDGVDVVYNGLNEDFVTPASEQESLAYRRELGIPVNAKVVGSIFRMYEEKDPMLWVEVAGRIASRRENVYFLLVGTGPMKGKLLELAADGGFSDRLLLPGTHKNPAVPLSIMDVFFLSSRYEGTPNVLMEAQMLGVPVVSTDAGGVRETMLLGETGIVLDNRSPESLAGAVLNVLEDPSWRMRAQERGPSFIRSRFGLDRMVSETVALYDLAGSQNRAVSG